MTCLENTIKVRFKRRTLHVPNLMQMSEDNRFFSFALDSAHDKFDVWNGPKKPSLNHHKAFQGAVVDITPNPCVIFAFLLIFCNLKSNLMIHSSSNFKFPR